MALPKFKTYGWRKQQPDPRDKLFGLEEHILTSAELPAKFSLRQDFLTVDMQVFNQLQLGACVPNHAVENIMFRAREEGWEFPNLSRLFVYYEGRKAEGSPLNQDTGMQVRTAFKVLGSEGAPPETDWPYSDADPGPFDQQPPPVAYSDATKFEAITYKLIDPSTPGAPMRTAIYNKMPISFGFPVPQQFEDPNWNPATTALPLPNANTPMTGDGHCENVIGWDFTLERFPVPVWEIRNSWDSSWGDQGHHWMDYQWFTPSLNLASDCWVIVTTKN